MSLGPKGHLRGAAVTAPGPEMILLPPGRRCSECSKNTLSGYNRDPRGRCNACQVSESARLASKVVTTEDRIVGYLSRSDHSAEWLAYRLKLGLVPVKKLLSDLIDGGVVDFGEPGRTTTHRHRTTYRIVVDPSEGAG